MGGDAETERGGVGRRLVAVAKSGSVLVGVVAAALGLAFNWNAEQRRVAELNLEAMGVAESRIDAFARDPHNTIAWLEAGFPRHAYCAGLTVFIARAASVGDGVDAAAARNMNDAVGLEIDRIGSEVGVDAAQLAAEGRDEGRRLADAQTPGACGGDVGESWLARQYISSECARVLGAYRKNNCFQAWREASSARLRAERTARRAEPEGAAPPPPPDRRSCADPDGRPMVYLQYVDPADRSAAEAVREGLVAAGWRLPGIDLVEGAGTQGDIRYYYPDQMACVERLAEDALEALPDSVAAEALRARGFDALSLAGAYRNLPRGRVELWLPDL